MYMLLVLTNFPQPSCHCVVVMPQAPFLFGVGENFVARIEHSFLVIRVDHFRIDGRTLLGYFLQSLFVQIRVFVRHCHGECEKHFPIKLHPKIEQLLEISWAGLECRVDVEGLVSAGDSVEYLLVEDSNCVALLVSWNRKKRNVNIRLSVLITYQRTMVIHIYSIKLLGIMDMTLL